MADGGAEHARLAVFVRPGHHGFHRLLGYFLGAVRILGFLFDDLLAAHERNGGRENLHIVIKLLFDCGPVGEAGGRGMLGDGEVQFNRLLRAVTAGLEAETIKPRGAFVAGLRLGVGIAHAIGVHGAVEIHAGQARAMRRKHGRDGRRIVERIAALVVDDHIVALGVVGVAENRQRRFRGFVVRVNLIHHDVHARFETLF